MPPLVGINRMNNDYMNHTMTTGIKYGYGLLNKKARDQSFYTDDKNRQIIDQEAHVGQEKYQNEK